MGRTTLVLGGARSGKSEVAEAIATALADTVTYVAAGEALDREADPDWTARVDAHRARRPAAWTTVEASADLAPVLARLGGVVIVDSLGTWVASSPEFAPDATALIDALVARDGDTIVVSDEVGLGVHPDTAVGLAFRDALGSVNRAVAAAADEAWLVVAGRRLRLEAP